MQKLAAQTAGRIEADILTSGLQVGQVFGSENELRERYEVSRAVLREAIRLVEHHKVATMRRGPSGGLIVRAPDSGPLVTALVIYLEHVGTSVEDLLAVRLLLEPLAARLAATRITESGITTLRDTVEQERASASDLSGRDLLHTALGRLSGNAALQLFIDVLVQLTALYARQPPRPPRAEAEAVRAASDHAHHAIVDSIIAGDLGRADQRTVTHLRAMREWLLSAGQRPIDGAPRSGSLAGAEHGTQKLAEIVARRMIADIAASGAQVGEVIGSESELLERFGVSRAAFREAVRLLEYHSVARMRRGPGGGLIVAEPDATASIEAMAIYLDYEKVGVADLREVRDVIESGSLELVAARRDDAAVAERLRQAARFDAPTPSERAARQAHFVHTEIAELSGNPILAVFLRIITTVWSRHTGERNGPEQAGPARPDQETADFVARVHQGIIDAVLSGDLPLAHHRMRRHLEALNAWWQ